MQIGWESESWSLGLCKHLQMDFIHLSKSQTFKYVLVIALKHLVKLTNILLQND